MNKLLVVLFGVVVAVHSFSIPVSRDALLEHSFNVESLSSEDSPLKDSSVEYSHSEVLPLEHNDSEDQLAGSLPSESSQAEESQQEQSEESSQAEESHPDQSEESSQAEESNQEQPEESSPAEESHQEQPEESSQSEESHANESEDSSNASESHSDDQPSESSHVEESDSEDEPSESSPADDSHSESHPADNPLATELPEEDLDEEYSPAQDEDKKDEEEEDDDLPEDYYDDQELKAVSNGLYRFSSEFYKKTAATRTRNLICSPLSVGVLLAMTAQGARGVTEKEMRKGLHLPEDSSVSKTGYQSLINSIHAEKKVEVHLANAVFMNDEIEMTPEFESVTKEYFRSPVEKVPFYYPDEASDVINYWVEERTHGKVKNVVKPEDAFDSEMILLNAVYFKGSWQSKFHHENTEEKVFNIDNKHYKKVPTMYQKNTFNYGVLPHLKSVYVELPYEHLDEDDEMSMFIVLPNEVTGLKKLINASEKVNFEELHNNPKLTTVKLYVPKFKVRSTLNLQPVLEKMGMRDMFRYRANFTGITVSRNLSVSKVVQKAYLEVNEEGSEAAAATVVELSKLSASLDHEQEPVEMHVDHPFMYAIYHKATNTVLFQGHVRAPALK